MPYVCMKTHFESNFPLMFMILVPSLGLTLVQGCEFSFVQETGGCVSSKHVLKSAVQLTGRSTSETDEIPASASYDSSNDDVPSD